MANSSLWLLVALVLAAGQANFVASQADADEGNSGHDNLTPDDLEHCIEESSSSGCENYFYPYYEQDLESCCEMMPFMVGCTLKMDCEDGALNGSACNPFTQLIDICLADEGMQSMGCCSNITQMCAEDTVVLGCIMHPPHENIISTSDAMENITAVCEENPDFHGCESCVNDTGAGCPAPLHSISELCLEHGDEIAESCEGFTTMCNATDESIQEAYCESAAGNDDDDTDDVTDSGDDDDVSGGGAVGGGTDDDDTDDHVGSGTDDDDTDDHVGSGTDDDDTDDHVGSGTDDDDTDDHVGSGTDDDDTDDVTGSGDDDDAAVGSGTDDDDTDDHVGSGTDDDDTDDVAGSGDDDDAAVGSGTDDDDTDDHVGSGTDDDDTDDQVGSGTDDDDTDDVAESGDDDDAASGSAVGSGTDDDDTDDEEDLGSDSGAFSVSAISFTLVASVLAATVFGV